jgi:hypothetical protein
VNPATLLPWALSLPFADKRKRRSERLRLISLFLS